MEGEVSTYKCVYDENRIYFALEIPGEYRFNTTDNHKCASIATMTKVGKDATFMNMGGCPDAMGGCSDGVVPDTCETYTVDIGAHWELRTTKQGVAYNVPETTVPEVSAQSDTVTPLTGDDPIANNDDEYSVSPFCRFDDNDANAGNEWAGAWVHTNPIDGEFGLYRFEISRSLKTPSTVTDAQMSPGGTYSFGVAFWDPFETESGWSDAGHYVTGCGTKWIDLELVTKTAQEEEQEGQEQDGEKVASTNGSSASSISRMSAAAFVAIYGLLSFIY